MENDTALTYAKMYKNDNINNTHEYTCICDTAWWRHQMETFPALLALCLRNSPVTGEFPAQRPVTRSFNVFFDLRLNKRLSKQSWGWWFETPQGSLWRHRNGFRSACLLYIVSTYSYLAEVTPTTSRLHVDFSNRGITAMMHFAFHNLWYLLWWCKYVVCKV